MRKRRAGDRSGLVFAAVVALGVGGAVGCPGIFPTEVNGSGSTSSASKASSSGTSVSSSGGGRPGTGGMTSSSGTGGTGGTSGARDAGKPSTSSSSSSGACGDLCAPDPVPIDGGWLPVAVSRAATGTQAACPKGYDMPAEFRGSASPTATPKCTCACQPAVEQCMLSLELYDQSCGLGTGQSCETLPLLTGACTPLTNNTCSAGLQGLSVTSAPILLDAGCEPITTGVDDGGVGPACLDEVVACTTSMACAGDGGICLPSAPGFMLCVTPTSPALTDCMHAPDGYQAMTVLAYGTCTDDRTCSPCTCGAPDGGACDVTVTGYNGNVGAACSGTPMPFGEAPFKCTGLNGATAVQTASSVATQGTCTPAGGPDGGITISMPKLFCCASPPAGGDN